MAVPSNTIQAVGRVGVREDLADVIYNISPTDTPFISAIGRTTAQNTYHEWQTDVLRAANPDNYTIQGDDLANESRAGTTRVGTYTQISKAVIGTSSTMQAVRAAGRTNEHSYQIAKAGKELKRDMEARCLANKASVAPTSSVAGQTAGALAWLSTNASRGVGGTSGGFSAGIVGAATNGTQRAFTEALLKTTLANIWTAGGDPSLAIMGITQKQVAAGFAGLAVNRVDNSPNSGQLTIIAGADVYVSDVGKVSLVADRFASARDALVVDPSMWSIATLDPMKTVQLAKTGLADRTALYTEYALRCNNEAASGVVADLT